MATVDHATIQEWLQRELDDGLANDLTRQEHRALQDHLEQCADCRAERRDMRALHHLLAASTVSVREGFQEEVMAALPATAWEARNRRAWRLPLALLAVLLATSAALLRLVPDGLDGSGGSIFGVVTAVADLFQVALVTGAGLLGHSWQGMRLVLHELVSGSTTGLLGLAALLLGLNALLFLALRRRPRRAAATAPTRKTGD